MVCLYLSKRVCASQLYGLFSLSFISHHLSIFLSLNSTPLFIPVSHDTNLTVSESVCDSVRVSFSLMDP